jgi:phage-related protein
MADQEVKVILTADSGGAVKGFRVVGDEADRTSKKTENTTMKFGRMHGILNKMGPALLGVATAVTAVGAALAAAGVGALVQFTMSAVGAASRAEEVQNLFEVSFGAMGEAAKQWAADVSEATGVNDTTLKQMSGTLFNMTKAMGISEEAAFEMSTSLTQLSLDASSFFNLPFDAAFEKIRAGIAGETEPLKALGILVTENAMKQLDFVKAIKATGRGLTEQEKVMARVMLIQQGLASSSGDLVRTQDSWANQTRRAGEALVDLQETVGQAILGSDGLGKSINFVISQIQEMTKWAKDNQAQLTDLSRNTIADLIDVFSLFFDVVGKGLDVTAKWFKFWWGIASNTILLFPRLFSDSVQETVDSVDKMLEMTDQLGDAFDDNIAEKIPEVADSIRAGASTIDSEVDAINASLEKMAGPQSPGRQFLGDFGQEFDRLSDPLGDFRDHFNKLTSEQEDFGNETKMTAKQMKEWEKRLKEMGAEALRQHDAMKKLREQQTATATKMAEDAFTGVQERRAAKIKEDTQKRSTQAAIEGLQVLRDHARETTNNVEKHKELVASQEQFNTLLAAANDLAQLIGGTLGSIVGQATAIGGSLKNLSVLGGGGLGGITSGIGSVFSKGMEEAGGSGIMGLIGGMTSVIPMIGPMIGPAIQGVTALVGALFKGPDIGRDVARDIGVGISEGLEEQIAESGKNAQLFVAEIFREGFAAGDPGATAGGLATEIGDIFSGIQQGLFSEGEGQAAIESAIPMLIERFGELGDVGEEQVTRIITAAQTMGIEFEGLNELIAAQMGPSVESVAEKFGLTVQQAKELGEVLGKKLPTEVQVLAAQLGVPASKLKELGAALQEQFGIPLDQIQTLMDTMGVSVEELAASMGVDLPEGIDSSKSSTEQLAEESAEVTNELGLAGEQANNLADALERAARASANVSVTTGAAPQGARGLVVGDIPKFAGGGIVPPSPGGSAVIMGEGGKTELAAPVEDMITKMSQEIAKSVGSGGTNVQVFLNERVLFDSMERGTKAGHVRIFQDSVGRF